MNTVDAFPETRVDPDLWPDKKYTTPETMHLCMGIAGVNRWCVDVAADKESHWAEVWYGIVANGLAQPWFGSVWCNPPFSDIEPWVKRAWQAMTLPRTTHNDADLVAMLLPANRTEQPWWQSLVEPWRDREPLRVLDGAVRAARLTTHFLPSRIRYGHPGNPKGIRTGSPPFASVLLVWRAA